jgi:hypothetical protein
MEEIIVFDFDKTLTNSDTVFTFFLFCSRRNPIRLLFIPFFPIVKILSKFHFISVKKEKEIGLKFFCPRKIHKFKECCYQFAKRLALNDIYYNELIPLINSNNKIVIVSASFQYYMESLFPGIKVIGTLMKTNALDQIVGICQHPFKEEKAILLQSKNLSVIKCFYTDSKNDLPTSKLAEKTIWVKHGKILYNR